MSTIISFDRQDQGVMTLTRIALKKDGDFVEYDVDLIAEITDSDLDALQGRVPGIREYFRRATEVEDGATLNLRPVHKDFKVGIATSDGAEIAQRASATLRQLVITTNAKKQILRARLRLINQSADLATPLVEALDSKLLVDIAPSGQIGMFDADADDLIPKVGNIVSGYSDGEDMRYGRVIEVKENGKVLIEDLDGSQHELTQVLSSVKIVAKNAKDLDKLINGYIEEARELGDAPSWRFVSVAIGKAFAESKIERGDDDGDAVWKINSDIIQRAVALHMPVDKASNG